MTFLVEYTGMHEELIGNQEFMRHIP